MEQIVNQLLDEVNILTARYKALHLEEVLNWEKYNHYAIVHHSTSIEGTSLTEEETQVLLDDGITSKGKSIEHHNMQIDLYKALCDVLACAKNV